MKTSSQLLLKCWLYVPLNNHLFIQLIGTVVSSGSFVPKRKLLFAGKK